MKTTKRRYLKGQSLEQKASLLFHTQGIPVLISSLVLRRRNVGQIDVAFWKGQPRSLVLVEVKSCAGISFKQKKRLQAASHYLGQLLNCAVQFSLWSNPELC